MSHTAVIPSRSSSSWFAAWLNRFASWLAKPSAARLVYALIAITLIIGGIAAALVIAYVFPESWDQQGTVELYRRYQLVGKIGMIVIGTAAIPFLAIVGATASYFWSIDTSKHHVLSWIAIVSDIAFVTAILMYVSFAAAPIVLYGHISDDLLHVLHVQAFAAGGMLGPLWIPNIVAVAVIGRRAGLFPTWLSWLAVLGVLTQFPAILGVTTLYGPFNAANGFISFYIPGIGPVTWATYMIAWCTVQWAKEHTADTARGETADR
ncbi:hypothetical protein [Nocardia colli]|uniref:hypothetical protein n=1 Tax=Nocardia colli TaxID=2545717 RepID=UPI0035E0D9DF